MLGIDHPLYYVAFGGAVAVLLGLEARHQLLPRSSNNEDFYSFQSKYLVV